MTIQPAGRRGMTLIELLLAIAIGVVLVTILVSLYRTVASTVAGQERRARGPHAAARALDALRGDFGRMLVPLEDPACVFTVVAVEPGRSILHLCALRAPEGDPDPDWAQPEQVDYRIDSAEGYTSALVRVTTPASGEGSLDGARTNLLVPEASHFAVSIFDGATWHTVWPPAEDGAARPRAARVDIAWGAGDPARADILLPTSISVTSSVLRAGAAEGGAADEAPVNAN